MSAARWPGLLVAIAPDGRYRVAARADDAAKPIGAELLACDGVPVDRLAAERLGVFYGRWFLASRRALASRSLLLDQGNPFAPLPRVSTLRWAGADHAVRLTWRPLDPAERDRRLAQAGGRAKEPIGERAFADGTRWFTLSGFDGDPAGADAKALVPLIARMKAERPAIGRARRVVLDLRGNDGGSSDWSQQIGAVLWGRRAVDHALPVSGAVEWRASADNEAALRDYRDGFRAAADASPDAKAWAERAYAGLAAARARGAPLWREPDDPPAPSSIEPPPPLAGRVFVVTDWGCASACLDAVDVFRALGAVQVGQETSGDTFYMDVRRSLLPSGLTRVAIPMKVYRGRPRGPNAPWTPRFRYTADLRDTDALERWIAALPA